MVFIYVIPPVCFRRYAAGEHRPWSLLALGMVETYIFPPAYLPVHPPPLSPAFPDFAGRPRLRHGENKRYTTASSRLPTYLAPFLNPVLATLLSQASLASGMVDVCLIPEVKFQLEGPRGLLAFVDEVIRRQGHAVICISEGAGQQVLHHHHHTTQHLFHSHADAINPQMALAAARLFSSNNQQSSNATAKMEVKSMAVGPDAPAAAAAATSAAAAAAAAAGGDGGAAADAPPAAPERGPAEAQGIPPPPVLAVPAAPSEPPHQHLHHDEPHHHHHEERRQHALHRAVAAAAAASAGMHLDSAGRC